MPIIRNVREIVREVAMGLRQVAEFEGLDEAAIREEKAQLRWRSATALAEYRAVDAQAATVEYVATCEVIDRMGDLVLTRPRENLGLPQQDGTVDFGRGFETSNFFLAGAPFLWSHMAREHAVGQVVATRQGRIQTDKGKVWATLQKVRYLTDERIPLAVPTLILVQEGIALAVSVGFAPSLTLWNPDDKTKVKLGLGRWGVVYLTSDQLELSQAQTPANPFAVRPGSQAKAIESLERAVAEGRQIGGVTMTEGLLRDFRRECALTEEEGVARLRERARGFLDMAQSNQEGRKNAEETEETEAKNETHETHDEPSGDSGDSGEQCGLGVGGTTASGLAYMMDPGEEDNSTLRIMGSRAALEGLIARLEEPEGEILSDGLEAQVERAGVPPPPQPLAMPAEDRARLQRAFDAVALAAEAISELCDRVDIPETRGLDIEDEDPQTIDGLLRATLATTRRVLAIVDPADTAAGGERSGARPGAQAIDEIQELFGA